MKGSKLKVLNVVGARPNFIKISPIIKALAENTKYEPLLLHTGQHYDYKMSESFFNELSIPQPDFSLEVGSGSHAKQVALIMERFDDYLNTTHVDMVLVVGDVNSTMACGLVAVKRGIKLIHVEAGIRSWDRSMPEEINRIVTDSISDLLLAPSVDAVENLRNEGHPESKIHFVGNIMIDTLYQQQNSILSSDILSRLVVKPKAYALITLHRPSNVDTEGPLREIVAAISAMQKDMKVVFPMHPRTKKMLETYGLIKKLENLPGLILSPPLGYHDFGKLVYESAFVLTDSGGIQEETTVYRIPCITLRPNTERPVTITEGTSELSETYAETILKKVDKIMNKQWKEGKIPLLWDGHTAKRIVKSLDTLHLG